MQQQETGISKYIPGLDAVVRTKQKGYPAWFRMAHAATQIASPLVYEYGNNMSNFLLDTVVDGGFAALAFMLNAYGHGSLVQGVGMYVIAMSTERIIQQTLIAKSRRR